MRRMPLTRLSTSPGYNRGAALARGEFLYALQDDDLPPADSCGWLTDALAAFAAWPRLAALTHRGGYFWFPYELGDPERIRAADEGPLFRDPRTGGRFEFLSTLAYGPVAFRAAAYRGVGGMDETMSPARGDCGIYADADLALRLWAAGWYVAHAPPRFERGPMEGGSSHASAVREACYTRQARADALSCRCVCDAAALTQPLFAQRHLNYHATARRFPAPFTMGILQRVADLNALLTREFEGPAPWEHPRARGGLGVSARANMTFA